MDSLSTFKRRHGLRKLTLMTMEEEKRKERTSYKLLKHFALTAGGRTTKWLGAATVPSDNAEKKKKWTL